MTFVKNGQTTTRSRGTRRLKKIVALWAYVTYKELGGIIRLDPSFSDNLEINLFVRSKIFDLQSLVFDRSNIQWTNIKRPTRRRRFHWASIDWSKIIQTATVARTSTWQVNVETNYGVDFETFRWNTTLSTLFEKVFFFKKMINSWRSKTIKLLFS